MRFFCAVVCTTGGLIWILFWLCASIMTIDDPNFPQNLGLICLLIMALSLVPLGFGLRAVLERMHERRLHHSQFFGTTAKK